MNNTIINLTITPDSEKRKHGILEIKHKYDLSLPYNIVIKYGIRTCVHIVHIYETPARSIFMENKKVGITPSGMHIYNLKFALHYLNGSQRRILKKHGVKNL
jgi:hypothetical protein